MLTPEEWEQVERLFSEAIAQPPEQREAFVEQQAGLALEVRREVEALLGPQELLELMEQRPLQEAVELVPGCRLLDRYTVIERIPGGGMADVYRVSEDGFDRELAMKVVKADKRTPTEREARFLREARLTGQLQHPNIVPVHSMGRLESGDLYFTLKLVKGRTLGATLAAADPLEAPPARLRRLLQVFERVCEALQYAHSEGVVHRDLKPANVMVGAFGEVQLLDWGIAKVLRPRPGVPASETHPDMEMVRTAAKGRFEPTEAGRVLGTLAYMAPEQARGEIDRVGPQTDVFGLGAILCEILTDASA